ncbi:MAG: serine/threonine protein kinase [Planctomycetes bacterium]|nr:serine/threonine protein kinase [Planctomycetota bacterium]
MSRTDPEGNKKRNPDGTQAWQPEAERPFVDPSLPKIPGITLHHEIARGGMGVVYAGRQDFLDRRVAVKLLSVELGGESFVQRFQREAKILAGIKHPNIVACHMAGQTDDGQSYLVMEFIDGPSLKKWIGDNGAVPVRAALRATRAVAQALGHAHTLGIIHRDVKPENILLETVTSTALDLSFPFTPKVVDLGLARANSGNAAFGLTSPGSVMGTPATMSPEQFDDPDSVDFRSDIYGLGCALFEMLVGQPAFRAKKLTDIVTAKRARTAPDPSVENPNVPPEVAVLVQSMLAPDREQRPDSYKALDEKLDELLQTIPDAPTPRVVGEETGQTIIAKPSQLRSKSKPPKPGTQPPKSQAPANPPANNDKSGPGLLRTAEINFLAEGLGGDVGPANAPPAFRDDDFAGAGPGGSSPKAGTVPPAAGPAPAPAVAPSAVAELPKKKGGVVAVVAVLAVAAAGGGYWMSRPADEPAKPGLGTGGDKPVVDGTDKPKPPPPVNKPPTLAIKEADRQKQKVGKSFTLGAEASDPEGKSLQFRWILPDGDLVSVKGATNVDTLRLQIDEGLPGLEIPITCEVSDGTNTEKRTHTVVVDEMAWQTPLVGFEAKEEWRRDDRSRWAPRTDPGDFAVSCAAGFASHRMSSELPAETYWEWAGSLESRNDNVKDKETPFAKVSVQFQFADTGYEILCQRSGEEGVEWSIEARELLRSGDKWEPRAIVGAKPVRWTEPQDTDDEFRAWFSVQRRAGKLVVRLGEARKPVDQSKPEIVSPAADVIEMALPANTEGGTIQLVVDQGIGRFRLKYR